MLTSPANRGTTFFRIADIDNLGRAEPPAQVLPAWVSPNIHQVPDLEVFLLGRRSRLRSRCAAQTINRDRLNKRSQRNLTQSDGVAQVTSAQRVFKSLSHATVLDSLHCAVVSGEEASRHTPEHGGVRREIPILELYVLHEA